MNMTALVVGGEREYFCLFTMQLVGPFVAMVTVVSKRLPGDSEKHPVFKIKSYTSGSHNLSNVQYNF